MRYGYMSPLPLSSPCRFFAALPILSINTEGVSLGCLTLYSPPYYLIQTRTMSGFEIAGLVLGAFPIALEALNQYEVVKAQIKLWRRIQEAYVECKDDLIFQQLLFEDNLLDLLSMATIDEKKIELLISNPDGECWKDESLTDLLEQEHYEPYRRCINAMERTMKELNHELGLDAEYVQQKLGSSVSLVL